MRVISKQRDFYDSAGYIDQSIIFVRKSERKVVDTPIHPERYGNLHGEGVLGFCGKFYPYIHCGYKATITTPEQNFYFYSVDEYLKSEFWKDREKQSWRRRKLKVSYRKFFTHWKDSDTLFIEVDAPYFDITNYSRGSYKGSVITNPSLIDMQFGKVMDAPTVFQTVQFYLTNQLVKIKDPDEIEDKYKILQHGFDKHSFRHPVKLSKIKDLK